MMTHKQLWYACKATIVINARDLVQAGWCQGVTARDRDGEVCLIMDERAVTFCFHGAVGRAAYYFYNGSPRDHLRRAGFHEHYQIHVFKIEQNEMVESIGRDADNTLNRLTDEWQNEPARKRFEVLDLCDNLIYHYRQYVADPTNRP